MVGGRVGRKEEKCFIYPQCVWFLFVFFFKSLQFCECRSSVCLGKGLPLSKVLLDDRHCGPCTAFQTSCIPGEAVSQPRAPQGPDLGPAILCFAPMSTFTRTYRGQIGFSSFLASSSFWEQISQNGVRRRVERIPTLSAASSRLLRVSGNQPNPPGSREGEISGKMLVDFGH